MAADFMDRKYYRNIVMELGARRKLGQNFLVNESIASFEAEYSKELNVIELGPGLGILTKELCKKAKKVISIEKDSRLVGILKESIKSEKLLLVEGDFFSIDINKYMPIDIMISNIPYNISSRVIQWLGGKGIPALLCMQKEFSDRLVARPGSREYSKLSVVASLEFTAHHVKDVGAGNFYPVPKVDSCIVYLAPNKLHANEHTLSIITLIMNHKKKTLRNAIIDSSAELGITKDEAKNIAEKLDYFDARPLHMEPMQIYEASKRIADLISK